MHRKASLNLSIQAIVIIVLAMALLGLGLGFIRGQFGEITRTTIDVQQQTREQVTGQLRVSGEKMAFPREVTMVKGKREALTLGVQNTGGATLNFKIILEWDLSNSDYKDDLGDLYDLEDPKNSFFELRWERECQSLTPADSQVYGISARAPNNPGTYALRAVVEQYPVTDFDCESDDEAVTHATKLAFITVG